MARNKIRPQIQRFRHVTQIYNSVPPSQAQADDEEPDDDEEGELKAFDGEVIGILEIED
jgi:hypothetical protein